jgi:carboxylesterase type B
LLIGTNNDEVAGMMAAIGLTDPGNDDILQALIDRFRLSDAGLSMYRLSRDTNSDMVAFCGAASDLLFGLPSLRMAQLHRGSNHVYRFTWQSPSLPRGMGADHSFDIPFIQDDFDSLLACSSVGREVLGADPPTELAREMHGAVVRFIAQGDPGWRQFDRDRGYVRHFGDGPIDPSPGVPSIDAGSSAVLGETRFDLCM